MSKTRLSDEVRRRRAARSNRTDPGEFPVGATRRRGTGRIRLVSETNPSRSSPPEDRAPEPAMDESRLLMMRREKEMTVEQRIELFERLSRDAAWVRSAKRVR